MLELETTEAKIAYRKISMEARLGQRKKKVYGEVQETCKKSRWIGRSGHEKEKACE